MNPEIERLVKQLGRTRTEEEYIDCAIDLAKTLLNYSPEKALVLSDDIIKRSRSGVFQLNHLRKGELYGQAFKASSLALLDRINAVYEICIEILPEVENNPEFCYIESMVQDLLAYFYLKIYNFDKAISKSSRAINLAEEVGDEYLLSIVYNTLGLIYSESGDYEYSNIFNLKSSAANPDNIATTAVNDNNIAMNYIHMGFPEKAAEYALKSIAAAEKHGLDYLSGGFEGTLGEVELARKNYPAAADRFNKAIKKNKEQKLDYQALLVLLGKAYLALSDDRTESTLFEALNKAAEKNDKKQQAEACLLLSAFYEGEDNYRESLEYYKKYDNLSSGISELNIRQIHKILSSSQKLHLSQKETEFHKKIAEEKKLSMKEANHRIKNNLSMITALINLQSAKTENFDLKELSGQISSIEMIHEQLYKNDEISGINFHRYIDSLLKNIFHNIAKRKIRIINNIGPVILNSDLSTTLGMIINELAVNTVKHAFCDQNYECYFMIALEQKEEFIMTQKNNGRTFDPSFLNGKESSLGQQLLKSLIKQIGGNISFESNDETIVTIRFPLQ